MQVYLKETVSRDFLPLFVNLTLRCLTRRGVRLPLKTKLKITDNPEEAGAFKQKNPPIPPPTPHHTVPSRCLNLQFSGEKCCNCEIGKGGWVVGWVGVECINVQPETFYCPISH